MAIHLLILCQDSVWALNLMTFSVFKRASQLGDFNMGYEAISERSSMDVRLLLPISMRLKIKCQVQVDTNNHACNGATKPPAPASLSLAFWLAWKLLPSAAAQGVNNLWCSAITEELPSRRAVLIDVAHEIDQYGRFQYHRMAETRWSCAHHLRSSFKAVIILLEQTQVAPTSFCFPFCGV